MKFAGMGTKKMKIVENEQTVYHAILSAGIRIDTSQSMENVEV